MGIVEAGILVLALLIAALIPVIVILRRQMRTLKEADRLAERWKADPAGRPGKPGTQADRSRSRGREKVLWEEEEEDGLTGE